MKQRFASFSGIVHKLEETEVEREFLFNWLRVLQLPLTSCSLYSNSLFHVTSPFLL